MYDTFWLQRDILLNDFNTKVNTKDVEIAGEGTFPIYNSCGKR